MNSIRKNPQTNVESIYKRTQGETQLLTLLTGNQIHILTYSQIDILTY